MHIFGEMSALFTFALPAAVAQASELQEKDPLLLTIAQNLATVGLCEEAHTCFLRGGDVPRDNPIRLAGR